MPVTETTSLLPRVNGANRVNSECEPPPLPFRQRFSKFIKAEGEPTWLESYKWFIFGNYFNVLLFFVPLSAVAHYADWDVALRFGFSFMAIMPLASMLGRATEQMSVTLGQTVAGLLNASFGNAVEIIVGIAALLQDELRIVQTSMLGSILSNILLVLGCSFLAGGLKRTESHFKATAGQVSSSLMTLACITLVIPAAYASTVGDVGSKEGLLVISRGTAILLLLVYIAFIYFQLNVQDKLEDPADNNGNGANGNPGDAAEQGGAAQAPAARQGQEAEEPPKMSVVSASVALLGVTVVTAFCADYMVASIEEFAVRYHVPKAFIGLILLPLVGNAAEHVTSVWMAIDNKMEATITISVGSSIQIASFVVPLLVIIGWISGHELTLYFANFETIVLFVSVLLVNTLIQDGKSNYMEGLMLVSLYFVISLAFWVS
jgi:Ca2+:H+ antiporter